MRVLSIESSKDSAYAQLITDAWEIAKAAPPSARWGQWEHTLSVLSNVIQSGWEHAQQGRSPWLALQPPHLPNSARSELLRQSFASRLDGMSLLAGKAPTLSNADGANLFHKGFRACVDDLAKELLEEHKLYEACAENNLEPVAAQMESLIDQAANSLQPQNADSEHLLSFVDAMKALWTQRSALYSILPPESAVDEQDPTAIQRSLESLASGKELDTPFNVVPTLAKIQALATAVRDDPAYSQPWISSSMSLQANADELRSRLSSEWGSKAGLLAAKQDPDALSTCLQQPMRFRDLPEQSKEALLGASNCGCLRSTVFKCASRAERSENDFDSCLDRLDALDDE